MSEASKVAVVTGGGRGLGKAIAKRLASDGYAIALLEIDKVRADQAASELRVEGAECIGIEVDVSSENQVVAAKDIVVKTFGRVDVLVNNAGIGSAAPTLSMPVEHWDLVIDTHLKGTFVCSKVFAAVMTGERCSIVNIASIMAFRLLPSRAAYASAKAGIIAFTKVTAGEWATRGIRVNAVAPGYVETELVEAAVSAGTHLPGPIVEHIPIGRMGEPSEVASAVSYLVSEEATFVTGHVLVVDGGYSAFGAWWPADIAPPGVSG